MASHLIFMTQAIVNSWTSQVYTQLLFNVGSDNDNAHMNSNSDIFYAHLSMCKLPIIINYTPPPPKKFPMVHVAHT
jgi:hypothetical protein